MILKIRRKLDAEGFTLIELMIVVAIIGILAAVAIPAFIDYIRKSKTSEVPEICDKMYKGVVDYFDKPHGQSDGTSISQQMPGDFGGGANALAGGGWTTTADLGGVLSDESAYVGASAFADNIAGKGKAAKAIKFVVTEAIYGGYTFHDRTTSSPPTNGQSFTCEGYTDIDDDGTVAQYWKQGSFNSGTRTFQGGAIWKNDGMDEW